MTSKMVGGSEAAELGDRTRFDSVDDFALHVGLHAIRGDSSGLGLQGHEQSLGGLLNQRGTTGCDGAGCVGEDGFGDDSGAGRLFVRHLDGNVDGDGNRRTWGDGEGSGFLIKA